MKIQPIRGKSGLEALRQSPPPDIKEQSNPSFGVHIVTKTNSYSTRATGLLKNYKLDVYTVTENGELTQKLYYLSGKLGNWVKSKLKFYKGNKVHKVIRSENNV